MMNAKTTTRTAAVQIVGRLGEIDVNLEACDRQVRAAVTAGAQWVVLPEFFSTGVGYIPALAEQAAPLDGAPTQMLRGLAREHAIHLGGSTLVRDTDGHVRNAFLLVDPHGAVVGRHDKDLPTMWESALYTGGSDPGRLQAGEHSVGVALCWEMLRTQTVRRLTGQVDLVVGGSGWWSVPDWPLIGRVEKRNVVRATAAPSVFAKAVGAPVVHAAHAGDVTCPFPATPITYRGHFEGGAQICAADGTVLAMRTREQGEGIAIADITPGRTPARAVPDKFWLQQRGALAAAVWAYQNVHGRRAYRRSNPQPATTTLPSVHA